MLDPNKKFDMGSESTISLSSSMVNIPMEMDITRTEREQLAEEWERKYRERWFIRMAQRMIPHIGLVLLLLGYLLVGATIFHYIEGPNEIKQRDIDLKNILQIRDNFHDQMWSLMQNSNNKISREAFYSMHQEYFKNLTTTMFESYKSQFINENHLLNKTEGTQLVWSFPNSIFYATSVLTTNGNGNLMPATTYGRTACIIFAILGIPLMFATIGDIGRVVVSELLSCLYRHYRSFAREAKRLYRRQTKKNAPPRGIQRADGRIRAGSINLHDMDDDSELSIENELRMPLTLVFLVVAAYTAIGGLFFQFWEGLQYNDALYSSFTTMATIGPGEIVPNTPVYICLSVIYIIFGLSIAHICKDFAETEYIRKIHYLGCKIEDARAFLEKLCRSII